MRGWENSMKRFLSIVFVLALLFVGNSIVFADPWPVPGTESCSIISLGNDINGDPHPVPVDSQSNSEETNSNSHDESSN